MHFVAHIKRLALVRKLHSRQSPLISKTHFQEFIYIFWWNSHVQEMLASHATTMTDWQLMTFRLAPHFGGAINHFHAEYQLFSVQIVSSEFRAQTKNGNSKRRCISLIAFLRFFLYCATTHTESESRCVVHWHIKQLWIIHFSFFMCFY